MTEAFVTYMEADASYRKQKGESQSHLKCILNSPAHYKAASKRFLRPSSNMIIGTATHCKTLEGDEKFNSDFVKKPPGIRYTNKEGRDWKESQGKKTILSNDGFTREYDSVIGMTESLRNLEWFDESQPDYRKHNEVSIYWEFEGVECKARLDRIILTKNHVHVLDLKTTDSISTEKFQSKLVDLSYDFQAGWYAWAAELVFKRPVSFTFVAVERSEPWSIKIFDVPDEMMQEARIKNHQALETLKECRTNDSWPSVKVERQLLRYPKWYSPLKKNAKIERTYSGSKAFDPIF